MAKLEYGTRASVCEGEVNEVYADIMLGTEEEQELNSDIIGATEAETKALIRRKLEVKAYMEYSGDCDYVDFINSGGVVKGG